MQCSLEFNDYGATVAAILGVGSNIFLLYVIATVCHHEMKGRQAMQIIITLYNIYYSIALRVIHPAHIMDKYGWIIFSRSFIDSYIGSWVAMAIHITGFAQVLSLLLIHCFYRYIQITGKCRSAINTKTGVISIVSAHILIGCVVETCCFWALEPTETRTLLSMVDAKETLNITIKPNTYYYGAAFTYPGPSGSTIYNWQIIIATGIAIAAYCIMYFTACVIGVRLYQFVKLSLQSKARKRLLSQLLLLLLAQAISPFFWELIPGFVVLLGGLFGLPHNWGLCATVYMAGYSTSDAVLALMLFKAYRRRTIEILLRGRCRGRVHQFATSTTMENTTDVPPSGNRIQGF